MTVVLIFCTPYMSYYLYYICACPLKKKKKCCTNTNNMLAITLYRLAWSVRINITCMYILYSSIFAVFSQSTVHRFWFNDEHCGKNDVFSDDILLIVGSPSRITSPDVNFLFRVQGWKCFSLRCYLDKDLKHTRNI